MKTDVHSISLSSCQNKKCSRQNCRENQNTHLMFDNPPPPKKKNLAIHEIMWKTYCRAGQATDDNTAHEQCLLDTQRY